MEIDLDGKKLRQAIKILADAKTKIQYPVFGVDDIGLFVIRKKREGKIYKDEEGGGN